MGTRRTERLLWHTSFSFPLTALVLDDERTSGRIMRQCLLQNGVMPYQASSMETAQRLLQTRKVDAVFVNVKKSSVADIRKLILSSPSNVTSPIIALGATSHPNELAFDANHSVFLGPQPQSPAAATRILRGAWKQMTKSRLKYHRVADVGLAICMWKRRSATAHVLNLSSAGALLRLVPTPTVRTALSLFLPLPDSGAPVRAEAAVVRHANPHTIGVRINPSSSRDRNQIARFIRKQWSSDNDRFQLFDA